MKGFSFVLLFLLLFGAFFPGTFSFAGWESPPSLQETQLEEYHLASPASPPGPEEVAEGCTPVVGADFSWQPVVPTVGTPVTFTASAWATAWVTETVDTFFSWPIFPSLVLDAAGHPHIAYCEYDFAEGYLAELRYAYYNGSSWEIQVLDAVGNKGDFPMICAPSLLLDEQGHPHLAYNTYFGPVTSDLKYMWYDGTFWWWQIVDRGLGEWGGSVSMALDTEGYPHIAYHRDAADYGSEGTLHYAFYNGSTWVTQTVDGSGDVGCALSLELDAQNHPHITYYKLSSPPRVWYVYYSATSWISTSLPIVSPAIDTVSLVLDSSDLPHILVSGWGQNPTYVYSTGAEWITMTVDPDPQAGAGSSLALDSSGRPYASYGLVDGMGNLQGQRYAYLDGTSWITETVDRSRSAGYGSSLALDTGNLPHLAYTYYDPYTYDSQVAYARFAPTSISPTWPVTYTWSFGDGSIGVGETVSHTYTLPSTYTVRLTATNCLTATAVSSHTLTVLPPCEGVQLLTLSTVISGCQVSFQAEVSGTPPISYLWEFGDGITSTEESPVHLYPASGVYSGTLRLRNCGGEAVHPFTVAVECPVGWRIYLPLVFRRHP